MLLLKNEPFKANIKVNSAKPKPSAEFPFYQIIF
jgi:hypothetical protein